MSRSHESFPALLFFPFRDFGLIFSALYEEETEDLSSLSPFFVLSVLCRVLPLCVNALLLYRRCVCVCVCAPVFVCVSCWTQGVNVQSEQLQESERCS